MYKKKRFTWAEPRSKMLPANIPLTKFCKRSPSSSIASLRLTTSGKRDIAFAFSSSYWIWTHYNQRDREYQRTGAIFKPQDREFIPSLSWICPWILTLWVDAHELCRDSVNKAHYYTRGKRRSYNSRGHSSDLQRHLVDRHGSLDLSSSLLESPHIFPYSKKDIKGKSKRLKHYLWIAYNSRYFWNYELV